MDRSKEHQTKQDDRDNSNDGYCKKCGLSFLPDTMGTGTNAWNWLASGQYCPGYCTEENET